jgi:hypothetical protein
MCNDHEESQKYHVKFVNFSTWLNKKKFIQQEILREFFFLLKKTFEDKDKF